MNYLTEPINRVNEIEKRLGENVLLFDKKEFDSLKKLTKTTPIDEYKVMTDSGWVDIKALHETVEYQVYELKLTNGISLKCADNHIIFDSEYNEVFVKDLIAGDEIIIKNGGVGFVESVIDLGYKEVMYDLELDEDSDRRYYTNGILSHNTELAKKIAEQLFGDQDSLIRLDMSEYMEKHTVSRMVGAPPGYVGYEQGGQLTEKVRRRPYSVILFDEIEKAHTDVFNLLLQLLDEGQLTDGLGRKVDFKNCLIILTSNVGVKELSTLGTGVGFKTDATIVGKEQRDRNIIQKALKKKFSPEFLNRIDDTIIFNSLKVDDIKKIIAIEIEKLKKNLTDLGYEITLDSAAIDFLVKEGYDEAYGARPLNRAIQVHIGNLIADEILMGNIKEGSIVKISYDKKTNKVFVK